MTDHKDHKFNNTNNNTRNTDNAEGNSNNNARDNSNSNNDTNNIIGEPAPRGAMAWMASHSVAANLLMLILLAGGLVMALRIKQEVFPNFAPDMVVVTVPYPGASPQEVEQSINLAIEEQVQGLDDVYKVSSSAREGVGTVYVDMLVGGNLQKLTQDVKNAVDRIQSFPEQAEKPRVMQLSRKTQVVSLMLYGNQSEKVLRAMAENIRDGLLQDKHITQVELSGTRPYEISIEVSQETLRKYNLTLGGIAARVRAATVELPGGEIKTAGGEILLRVKERRYYGRQFDNIPIISLNDGTQLLLGQIATIKDNFEDIDKYASYNGKRAIMINVFRIGNQTPIEVANAVKKHVNELKLSLPPGVHIEEWLDMSKIYRQRIELLLHNGFQGLVVVFILLGLFLEARLAFWVTMGIPTAFLGTLLLMPAYGLSINMISMFAFIVALGIVVDDAIVVGENIYYFHQQGMSFSSAAIKGVRQMAMPVTFSVLTNMVTFMPMFFVPGIMGKIFRVIPAVVLTIFFISLIEALFILPSHLGHQKEIKNRGLRGSLHHFQQRFSRWFTAVVKNYYGPLLDWTLRYRYITIACGVFILTLVMALVISGRMGMSMFPDIESDYAVVSAELPYGSAVAKTRQVQQKLLKAARQVIASHGGSKLARGIYSEIGGVSAGLGDHISPGGPAGGGNTTTVNVSLTDPDIRPITTRKFVQLWRKRVGQIAGLKSLVFSDNSTGPGAGASLTIELSHRNLQTLEKASNDLARALSYFPNVKDINNGFTPGKEQLNFKILPAGQSLGLTARDVGLQLRNAFYGAEARRQQRGRNEMKIMVRYPKNHRISEADIDNMFIHTPGGQEVPLRKVVRIIRGRSYTSINRLNGRRVIAVTANVFPTSQTNRVIKALEKNTLPELIKRYPSLGYSYEGKQADMRDSMQSLEVGFLIAMLVMYALLAIPFNSYSQPIIIMISIPFGMVGAVLGHLLMGYSLSIISMFGVVALSGVVVNDVLILVDFANQLHRQGASLHAAIHAAGVQRFRPIMLTTLTTFGGLCPMIFETSLQAKFLIPMAISLGYGILFATIITLLITPSLYLIVEDAKRLTHRSV